MKILKNSYLWMSFLMLLVAYPVFFLHLDVMTLRIWDEARMASNTLEMYLNGRYLVPHFEGEPDMWCTKPPVLIWLQLGFMKVFGIGELAIRLPSALSAYLICLMILRWTKQESGSYLPGVVACMFLIVSPGFVGWHGVRTGDYDILLSLATTYYLYRFYRVSKTGLQRQTLWTAFAGLVLAFWIKGVAGLLFLPAVLIYLLWVDRSLVFNKRFLQFTGFSILAALSYYAIREGLNPGYIRTVYENEVGGRLLQAVEGHAHPFVYYFSQLPGRFGSGLWFFIPLVFYLYANVPTRRLAVYLVLNIGSYLLIISIAQTKLPWYDIPVYPLLALATGWGIWQLYANLTINMKQKWVRVLPWLVVPLAFAYPYRNMVGTTFKPKEYSWDEEYYRLSYYLRDKISKGEVFEDYILIDTVYCAHNKFYMNWANHEGSKIDFAHRAHYARTGKQVIAHQSTVHAFIRSRYEYTILDSFHNVQVYAIGARRMVTAPADKVN
ncbi:MAG: glycosyltransferase family 39 protein [Flavobacteriales bacterium]|nr:glycosyltransferase family 39 protein [Flavobacteriales bacterium]